MLNKFDRILENCNDVGTRGIYLYHDDNKGDGVHIYADRECTKFVYADDLIDAYIKGFILVATSIRGEVVYEKPLALSLDSENHDIVNVFFASIGKGFFSGEFVPVQE